MAEGTRSKVRLGKVFAYLRPRPVGLRSGWEFYRALLEAASARTVLHRAYHSPGQFLRRSIRVRVQGVEFELRPASDDLDFVLPGHKPALELWFRPKEGEVVVDIGAHLGFYSVRAALQGARVVAIEPNPELFEMLRSTTARHPTLPIVPVGVAIGSRSGRADLHVPVLGSGLGSLLPFWIDPAELPPTSPMRHLSVPVVTLDGVPELVGHASIDWLLVDVEGSEADVLASGAATLARSRHVILEVWNEPANREAVESALTRAGFVVESRAKETSRTEYWHALRSG